jgi:hypothetical protein
MARRRIAAVALLAAVACTKSPAGKKLASGLARGLVAGGGAVAFLLDARRPEDRDVPEDLLQGDLFLDDRKVGAGVATQEGAYAFSPGTTRLAWLGNWRFREGAGELFVARPGSEARRIAERARSFSWSPRGDLGWVGDDRIGVGDRSVSLPGVQAFSWSPDGKRIAARASASAGGRLWLLDANSLEGREVALGTSDFGFAADGALAALGPPPPKGGDRPLLIDGARVATATAFSFSPDGKQIALFSTAQRPGEATGDLYRLQRGAAAPQLVAARVSDWRWDGGGDLLCLGAFDLRSRAGTLIAARPGAPPREIGHRIQSFSVFGRRVLYVAQAPQKGDFKLELWGVDLAASDPVPRRLDEGVYGWELRGDTLYYKARCAGGARSCSLLRAPFAGGPSETLATSVAGFDLSRDGKRILIQRPHPGAPRAVDLAVIAAEGPPPHQLDVLVQEVDPSSRFADDSGRHVAYAIVAAGKGGVFLADVP